MVVAAADAAHSATETAAEAAVVAAA